MRVSKTRNLFILAIACLIISPAMAAEVREVTTPQGLTVWLIEDTSQPLFAVRILFKDAGAAYDPAGKEGRASLAAELLMEGAGDLSGLAFHEALENHAIRLSAGEEEDHFLLKMESLSEHKEIAFRLLGNALARPRFDEESIKRVKAEAHTALKARMQSPGYYLLKAWKENAYGAHPYAQAEEGTPESIARLSRRDFLDFRTRYLTKENILIAVVGDISAAELSALLDKNLSALPPAYTPEKTLSAWTLPQGKPPVVVEKKVPQTLVVFGGNGIRREDPRYFDALVMNHIIGGDTSLISRLGVAIREQRGLAYSVFSTLDPMRHAAEWSGSFSTRNAQAGEAVRILRETLRAFVEKGITEEELQDAKQYITGSFVLSLDTNSELAGFLISMQLFNLGREYLEHRNALVEAVTKEGVERMARELIHPDSMLMVLVGQPEGMNEREDEAKQHAPLP